MNRNDCIKKDMCCNEYICDNCIEFGNFSLKLTVNDNHEMKIECPYCKKKNEIYEKDHGTELKCYKCYKKFSVNITYHPIITATIILNEFNRK